MGSSTHSDKTTTIPSEEFYRTLKELYGDFRSNAPTDQWPLAQTVTFYGHKQVVDEAGHNHFMVALWSKKFQEAFHLYRAGLSCDLFNHQERTVFHSMIAAVNERFSVQEIAQLLDIYNPRVDKEVMLRFPLPQDQATWFLSWGSKILKQLNYKQDQPSSAEHEAYLDTLRFCFQGLDEKTFELIEQEALNPEGMHLPNLLNNPVWTAFKAEHTQQVLTKNTRNKGLAKVAKRKI